MQVGFIVQGLPGEGYHGGALTCWAIVRALVRAGHRVVVISLFDVTKGNPYLDSRGKQEASLRQEGVELVVIEYDMKSLTGSPSRHRLARMGRWVGRLADPSMGLAYVMPWVRLADHVRVALSGRTCDVFFCYHFDALAAVSPLGLFPLMAAVGDLWHLPAYFRWRESPFSFGKYSMQGTKVFLEALIAQRAMATLLKPTHKCGAFAGHYAEWLKNHGCPDALYLRTPIPDGVGLRWEMLRDQARAGRLSGKRRVLFIGDMGTTSTSSGLRSLVNTVLPRLRSEFGEDGFEVRLVGGGSPPEDLAPALQKRCVRMLGRVVPADPEFLAADLIIVPTNIPLGIRVRVITAWSFGCPVVAHRANASGIPEMRDGDNSLLADTDNELADCVVDALQDEALLKRLSRGGREMFEKCFSEPVAGQAIVDELERLAKQWRIEGKRPWGAQC